MYYENKKVLRIERAIENKIKQELSSEHKIKWLKNQFKAELIALEEKRKEAKIIDKQLSRIRDELNEKARKFNFSFNEYRDEFDVCLNDVEAKTLTKIDELLTLGESKKAKKLIDELAKKYNLG